VAVMFGPVVQIAYVVSDPRAAAQRWHERHGAGPFFLSEHIPVTDVIHRGAPSAFDHTSAYGWMPNAFGGVMIELFVQHDRAPSAVTERFAADEGGLHHLACFADSLDASLAAAETAGLAVAMTAKAGSMRFAFVDDVADSGHYWELYEPTPHLRGFYEMVRDASTGWDGTEPVRVRVRD
jgi:Glyoxalase/Bleomycin resistance protein/Dioxygenase superfamily